MGWIIFHDNGADAITGARIYPNDRVFDTGLRNIPAPFGNFSRTRIVKEETIVWLAEQAGYTVSRNDSAVSPDGVGAGVAESAPVVEREDASAGNGEGSSGADPDGGSAAPKRRSSRASKGK